MKYYVFNSSTNSWRVCNSLEELIKYFAYFNTTSYRGKVTGNSAFDNLAMNMNDTRVQWQWDRESLQNVYVHVPREIMVLDEDNRIIDPRLYKDQIFKFAETYKYKYTRWSRIKNWERYVFRRDPVPHLYSKSHRGSYYRHPKTTQERKLSCDVEVKQYINPSRNNKNLVNTWDEIPRHYDKSWKNQKIEKQWMKHLPKHVDTVE